MALPDVSNIAGKMGSGAGQALGTLGKVQTALSVYGTAKDGLQKAQNEWRYGTNPYDQMLGNKTAFESLDDMVVEKEAAMSAQTKQYMADIGRAGQAGLQKGIAALPGTLAVLGAGYLINRNLKGGMEPIRPSNQDIADEVRFKTRQLKKRINKEAAEYDPYDPKPWGDFFKDTAKNSPKSMAYALGTVIPAAALTLALGKNIRGRGETIPTRQPEYKKKMLLKKYKPHNSEENA